MPALDHTRDSDERLGLVDVAAEWLLSHCPFTTITVLTGLVVGSVVDIPRPLTWLIAVPAADLLINLVRARRRQRRSRPVTA